MRPHDGLQGAIEVQLAAELLERGLPWTYREISGSMRPTLRPYDRVEVRPVPRDRLRPGDIVAVARPQGLLVHRLLRIDEVGGQAQLTTRGDARPVPDPGVPASWLLGRVERAQRRGRWVPVGRGWRRHLGRLRGGLRWRWEQLKGLTRSVRTRMKE